MKNFSTYAVAQFNFTADKPERVEIVGKTIFYRSGSAEITVRLGSPSNPAIPLKKGERLECDGFDVVILESTSTQNVVLLISPDNVKIEGINVVGEMSINPGSALKTTADAVAGAGAKTEVIAANAARKEINIGNLSSNGSTIRVGDGDTGATRGQPLAPGQDVWLETEGAVSVWNPDASDASITLLENLK